MTTENEVLHYTQELCNVLENHYKNYITQSHQNLVHRTDSSYHKDCLNSIREGTYDFRTSFDIHPLRKYLKIVMNYGDGRSVHCFVNKTTGDVLKSASWSSPAKGVRYNLLNKESRETCYRNADWSGHYLYLR